MASQFNEKKSLFLSNILLKKYWATSKMNNYNTLHSTTNDCNDNWTYYVFIDKRGFIVDIKFFGDGCPLALVSNNMLTSRLLGLTVSKAQELIAIYEEFIYKGTKNLLLGELEIFENIHRAPKRHKCCLQLIIALKSILNQPDLFSSR